MSAWRRVALKVFEDDQTWIQNTENAHMLWTEISLIFSIAVEKDDHKFIQQALKYARWCASPSSGPDDGDAVQGLLCGFCEDIARDKKLWPFFKIWFSTSECEYYSGSFKGNQFWKTNSEPILDTQTL